MSRWRSLARSTSTEEYCSMYGGKRSVWDRSPISSCFSRGLIAARFRNHSREYRSLELIEAVVESFLGLHPRVKVQLNYPSPDVEIDADVELLARAVMNLLDNSARHAGAETTIQIGVRRHRRTAASDGGETMGPELTRASRARVRPVPAGRCRAIAGWGRVGPGNRRGA